MIKLVLDSCVSLDEKYLTENDIKVAKFNLLIGDEQISEPVFPNYNEVYEKLVENNGIAKTSQPSVEEYSNIFKQILDNGDEIICLTMATRLSGSYNCAEMVAKQLNSEKISVIDSHTLIQGMRILVDFALDLIKQGKTREEVVDAIIKARENIVIEFIPPSLDPLKRGGRIGKVSALIGSVLKIKPILRFKDNVLTCAKKVMGFPKAIASMVNSIPENCKKLYLIYVHSKEYLKPLKDALLKRFKNLNLIEENISATVGIHVGVGCVGVTYC